MSGFNCTAHQSSPLRRKLMLCYILNPALSLLMKHLVTGQRQKAPNFSAFHWSPHGSLVTIGQHFIITKVVHLPKWTKTSLVTEPDRSGPNHRIGSGFLAWPCIAAIAGFHTHFGLQKLQIIKVNPLDP